MRKYFAIGAFLGAIAVTFGAFGSHVLEDKLSEEMLEIYDVANRYHFIHAITLMLVSLGANHFKGNFLWSARLLLAGVVIFSGSLYVLSLSNITWLGAITPIGGVLMIVGWLLAAIGTWRSVMGNVEK